MLNMFNIFVDTSFICYNKLITEIFYLFKIKYRNDLSLFILRFCCL